MNKLSPHNIFEELNVSFRQVRLCDLQIPGEKMAKLFANSVWFGSELFANYPFGGLQIKMDKSQ